MIAAAIIIAGVLIATAIAMLAAVQIGVRDALDRSARAAETYNAQAATAWSGGNWLSTTPGGVRAGTGVTGNTVTGERTRQAATDEALHKLERVSETDRARLIEVPPPSDEPSGTCAIHGHYWTDECPRCKGAS